jgi:hypothetical protein
LRDGTIKDAADLKATKLFKTKKGKKTVGDFLDQDFKRFEEDAADEIVKMKVIDREGVFGPKGKELVGVNAHAYELFNYLKARSGGKVFKNLAIDDLETYVTDLARAGANAKSVFDVLGDQTNWRIPQGFQRITVKALKDGKYEIAGVKGGKDVAISTVDNIDAVRSMIGTENANNLKRSMLKDRDATFVLDENDISKLPQGAPTTEEAYLADRFRQSGGVPLHKALESAGLVTSEADIKFATDNLMAQIRSLDVDPEMANAIATVYQPLTQPEVINQYFKVWDKATQWLKNNLTVPFPSFATRNLGSGQLMNMLASGEVRGVGDMIEYGKSIGRVHKAMADPVKMRELVQELDAHGLLPDERGFSDVEMGFGAADRTSAGFRVPTRAGWGGWRNFLKAFRSVSDDMSNEAADAFAELGKKRLRDRFGIRGTRRALKTLMETGNLNNQVVEFYNRATMYDYLRNKKGWSPYAAAEKVKELQFDYGDITTVDRYAKRGMPFYTFTKKMANAFVKSLAANPGGPMAATITAPARYEKREDKRPRPEYLSKGFAVPLEKAKDGSERYLTGFGLAWEDPMRFMSVDPNNIFQRQTAYELAGSMHPFIKGPAELMTGQSFFMDGRDLTDLDPTAGRLLTNVFGTGKPKEPPVNILGNPMASRLAESVLANSPASRYLTTARQLTDSRRDGLEKAVNFLTGIKTNIVTDKARDAMLRDAATQLLKESGGAVFERPYVNKQVLEQMPEAQRKRALVLSQLLQRLSERAKASKAGEPLPILFDR